MAQMSVNQVRLIDPVLTQVAQGFKQQGLVGGALFPTVTTPTRGAQLVTFGKEDFMSYATKRAPGTSTGRIGFSYSSAKYYLEDHKIAGEVPLETQQEATNTPGYSIDLAMVALTKAGRVLSNRLEIAQATAARDAATYDAGHKVTLSGTAQWSNLTASDPIGDIEAAKEAIRSSIGLLPNTLVIGPKVMAALRQHSKIIDRIKYTGRDVPTVELLASLFGVDRVVVGAAVQADDAGVFSDVWGKDAVLAYTDLSGLADQGSPTYGYTFNLAGYPLAEVPYLDRDRGVNVFPVARAEAPFVVAPTAGFLVQAAVA